MSYETHRFHRNENALISTLFQAQKSALLVGWIACFDGMVDWDGGCGLKGGVVLLVNGPLALKAQVCPYVREGGQA